MKHNDLVFYMDEQVITAETEQYLELTNRVCYYNYPNANGVQINYDDDSLKFAQKLINQPIQGKYTTNSKGEPTFKGHGVIKDGGKIHFDVANIGIHTDVYIEEATIIAADGSTQTLPCLYAKQIIWTLYHNYVAAVKRLYNEKRLHNSWVITNASYDVIDGVKHLKNYLFRANTFLGYEYSSPAYGESAEVIELSEKSELEISEALAKDVIKNSHSADSKIDLVRKGEIDLNKKEIFGLEKSDLSVADFFSKLDSAIEKLNADKCVWISALIPQDKIVWCSEEDNGEGEFTEYSYTVAENEVSVSKIGTVKPGVPIRKIGEVLSEKDKTISEKSEGIIALNSTISELKDENTKLSEVQEKYLKLEGERLEAEKQEKISELRSTIEGTKLFSKEEIETEFSDLLSELDEVGIKCKIADKITSNLTVTSETEKDKKDVKPKLDLSDTSDTSKNDSAEFLKWLNS